MSIVLTPQDRARIRTHLGYPSTSPATLIVQGSPAAGPNLFRLESAMSNLLQEGVSIVLTKLGALDALDAQLSDSYTRLKAQQIGELKLRNSNEEKTETDLLRDEYKRRAQELADIFGCDLNPHSKRFGPGGDGGIPINTPVWNGGL